MRRRIRIGIPDGILNDYLKGMTNERAAYEIIRLATNNLHGFSDSQALNIVANPLGADAPSQVSKKPAKPDSVNETEQPPTKKTEVSFEDDLQMLT